MFDIYLSRDIAVKAGDTTARSTTFPTSPSNLLPPGSSCRVSLTGGVTMFPTGSTMWHSCLITYWTVNIVLQTPLWAKLSIRPGPNSHVYNHCGAILIVFFFYQNREKKKAARQEASAPSTRESVALLLPPSLNLLCMWTISGRSQRSDHRRLVRGPFPQRFPNECSGQRGRTQGQSCGVPWYFGGLRCYRNAPQEKMDWSKSWKAPSGTDGY